MFKKILIANRGEIALRIMRACADLGIESVLVHSQADADSLPVSLADETYCIGPASAAKSYLNIPAIINVALLSGVDAIHPGYGFLAENAYFAEICREHKLKFIGPSPDVIRRMGDKSAARETMAKLKIPTVPGSDGLLLDPVQAGKLAEKIGYPILIKATAGGGGRGMRIVQRPEELESALAAASQEALAAFDNPGVYLEKYITNMRHIEFQIMGDSNGETVHCGERDCSIQRRHQKLIEEAPSTALSEDLRKKMGEAAVKVAKSVEYEGAGTIEFILDLDTNQFYFMEMNTRIQVEHPVTEQIYRIDLLAEQIKVAAGERLSFRQSDLKIEGHAIEFRVNAEDPQENFRPSPGLVQEYIAPGGIGIRLDSHCFAGYTIPSYYDSLTGKLIVYGKDREECIRRARRALNEFGVEGIKTTIPLFLQILEDPVFLSGDLTTNYLNNFLKS
ncbi:MAG: acetyl-CoA carboxylase biotin carboxylase subunit [Candidatus Caenarcaniphilales bacterium]|nr:acetyl-CoA carboxylase biotin carboxylase subunit [Candidatus Caenarcaniphilales bacterium]